MNELKEKILLSLEPKPKTLDEIIPDFGIDAIEALRLLVLDNKIEGKLKVGDKTYKSIKDIPEGSDVNNIFTVWSLKKEKRAKLVKDNLKMKRALINLYKHHKWKNCPICADTVENKHRKDCPLKGSL